MFHIDLIALTSKYLTMLEESPQICWNGWCLLFQELTVLFVELFAMVRTGVAVHT